MMVAMYTPQNWFWIVGVDETRAWSSAVGAYVTTWPPERVTRIASEADLSDVLRPHGLAVPLPTQEDYAEAIERHMEAVAQSLGYKNADRLASYVASSNAGWASEAAAFSAWRDAVWVYAYEQMALIQSGQRAASPSISQFLMELPSNTSDADGVVQRIENLENALGEFVARINGNNP